MPGPAGGDVAHHYTQPSRLTRLGYRFLYDPLRARDLRGLVAWLELQGSERVLVFGSGAGSEAIHIARALDRGGRLTCLDVSPTWLAEARRRLAGIRDVAFVLGEAHEVGLPDGAFDLVLAHHVLHDVDPASLPSTLEALVRALDQAGRFVVVEPATTRHGPSMDELRRSIEAAGLTETESEPARGIGGRAIRSVFRHV
jgi:ubiquinone/menaquinone biosynthesis C-methylase UbiE